MDLPGAAACLKRCALFVGNDSGLMHMAAAAGTPTLGLFGPTRDQHYAPWGPKGAAVRTEESVEALTGRPGFDHRARASLMGGLVVEAVERAALALLERCAPGAGGREAAGSG